MRGVRFSLGFKWLILLLLPITLAWKLAVRTTHPEGSAEKEFQLQVADFLVRQHFQVARSGQAAEGQPSIEATSGLCRMRVTKSPPVGWDRDLIRRFATPTDRVFVVFGGKVYAEQPTWLTAADFLWARLRRELGMRGEPSPVLGIVASAACDAEKLPWQDLDDRSK